MNRTPSENIVSRSAGTSPARENTLLTALRQSLGKSICGAVMALLAASPLLKACGGEEDEKSTPTTPIPECQTPERQDETAPRIEMGEIEISNNGQIFIEFTVPEFDEECKAPLRVRAIATLWRTPRNLPGPGEEPSGAQRSSQEDLPGVAVTYTAGANTLATELPPSADDVMTLALEVIDAQGNVFRTPQVRLP